MRVLFCSQAAHTGGGVEAWMETLTAALTARGIEVFTALAKGRFHHPARYAARHAVANAIDVDGSDGLRETRLRNLLRVFDRVRPDVIIPVHLADAMHAAAYAKTRGAAARFVVCLHGQGADRVEQVRRYAAFIDLAVSVSKRVALQLDPIVGLERVRHIPTGVPPPLQPPRVRQSLQSLGYVGRLDQTEKRVLDLIPLARALRGVTLHVAGSGPEEATLRRELPNAVFHGALSRRELYERVYPMLDALVILSESEAGPIVAWEAMAHGVVPVVSDFIGRAEEGVIRDQETGAVFPVGDVRAAAAAIERLAKPGAMAPLSRAAAALPNAYTLAGFEQAWLEALTRCLAIPPRRGAPADLPPLASAGRLARLPWLRRLLGRKFEHADPGSEWPH